MFCYVFREFGVDLVFFVEGVVLRDECVYID